VSTAEAAAQSESERRFREMLTGIRLVAVMLDERGRVTFANDFLLELTGWRQEEVLGRDWFNTFLPEEVRDKVRQGFEASLKMGDSSSYHGEHEIRTRLGERRLVQWNKVLVRDLQGKTIGFAGIGLDVTEHQRAEQALRASEDRYRRIVETAEEGIWAIDAEAKTTYVNRKMAEMLGYAPEEMVGQHLLAFMNEDQCPLALGLLGRRRQGVRETHEFLFRRKDGGDLWTTLSTNPILSDKGGYLGALAMATDITDRVQARQRVVEYQKRLRSLTSRLVLTEARERRRIAVFLHDQIGQALAMAQVRLAALRKAVAPEDQRSIVGEVANLLDRVIGDTRSVTFDLSPPILYELGFEAAVEWLAENVQQSHGLRVRFEKDGQPKPMAEDVRVILFVAVREVLTNIVKHAGAKSASVSISREQGRVRVSVVDDGRGFDVDSLVSPRGHGAGFGLFSIRERLEHLGGGLEVQSTPGQGTRIMLIGPLEDPPPAAGGGT